MWRRYYTVVVTDELIDYVQGNNLKKETEMR